MSSKYYTGKSTGITDWPGEARQPEKVMSETKLPDIVERLRARSAEWPEDDLIPDAMAEITRLRSHAGWHEAIEEAAKVCENYRDELERHHPNLVHAIWAADCAVQRIRALLPPGGEKG